MQSQKRPQKAKPPYSGEGIMGKPHIKYAFKKPHLPPPKEHRPSALRIEMDNPHYAPDPLNDVKASIDAARKRHVGFQKGFGIAEAADAEMERTKNLIKTLNNVKHYIMFSGPLPMPGEAAHAKASPQGELDFSKRGRLGEMLEAEINRISASLAIKGHPHPLSKNVALTAIENLKAREAERIMEERKRKL